MAAIRRFVRGADETARLPGELAHDLIAQQVIRRFGDAIPYVDEGFGGFATALTHHLDDLVPTLLENLPRSLP